jgi:hypothetical protein
MVSLLHTPSLLSAALIILTMPSTAAPNTRKKVMSSVVVLIQYLKGKHLILSRSSCSSIPSLSFPLLILNHSGCESSVHLRSPLDVSFLAQLLGIPIHKVLFLPLSLLSSLPPSSRAARLSRITAPKSLNTPSPDELDTFQWRFSPPLISNPSLSSPFHPLSFFLSLLFSLLTPPL